MFYDDKCDCMTWLRDPFFVIVALQLWYKHNKYDTSGKVFGFVFELFMRIMRHITQFEMNVHHDITLF